MTAGKPGLEPVETALSDPIGLIDMREMAASFELFNFVLKDETRCCFLRSSEDPVIGSPDHMQGLIGERRATSGESSASCKSRQCPGPAGALEVQRSNLLLRCPHIGVGISKGLPAKTSTHSRATEKPGTEAIQQGGHRHRSAGQSCRSKQHQSFDPLRVTAAHFHGDCPPHGGTDQAAWGVVRKAFQQGIQVVQHTFRTVDRIEWTR